MFRRHGKNRTLSHNIKIASLLSFVAGMVNVAGFFSVQRLTTNVTGHFAFFADEFVKLNLPHAFLYALYIFCFLCGAFTSSMIIEILSHKKERYVFVMPVALEIVLLCIIASFSGAMVTGYPNLVACVLLFAMGLQNAMVTSISNSVVRTTHLTGLFTDLGIELSQLFFYRLAEQQKKLRSSIGLRLSIISFFFTGGVLGGLIYSRLKIHTLYIACAVLAAGLIYNSIKLKLLMFKRKHQHTAN